MLAVGTLNAFVTFVSKDPVWALASIYLSVAVLIGKGEGGPRITVPLILVCVLQAVGLAAGFGWTLFKRSERQREGRIRLPQDEPQEEGEGERAVTSGQIA